MALEKLGDHARANGHLVEALRLHSERFSIAERLAILDPKNTQWQHDLAVSFERLGDVATDLGDEPEAKCMHTKQLAIAKRLATTEPGNVVWQRGVAVALAKKAGTQARAGDPEAVASCWKSVAVFQHMIDSGMHVTPADLAMIAQFKAILNE